MGQWIKTFPDGSRLIGSDLAVEAGIVSWSKTPTDPLISASLEHHGFQIEIVGPGKYWQSDTYESVYPGPGSVLLQRRIERLITPSDNFMHVIQRPKLLQVTFNTMVVGGQYVVVPKAWIGQWLILEYDLKLGIARRYTRSNRF
jgi:hypothetical protein